MMHHGSNYCDNLIACAHTHTHRDKSRHTWTDFIELQSATTKWHANIDGVQAFMATAKISLIFTQCDKREWNEEIKKHKHWPLSHIRVAWVSFSSILCHGIFAKQINWCWISYDHCNQTADEFNTKTLAITSTTKTITERTKGKKTAQCRRKWNTIPFLHLTGNDARQFQRIPSKIAIKKHCERTITTAHWTAKHEEMCEREGQREKEKITIERAEQHKIEMIILIVAENYEIS